MKKEKLLIVGGFEPNLTKGVGGGVLTSCLILKNSHIIDDFDLILLDSTSKSNPPPAFTMRLYWSLIRFFKFLKIMLTERPHVVLLFAAAGSSFLEKSFMGRVAQIFGCRSFLFLRANRLLDQIKDNKVFRFAANTTITKRSYLFCQGESVKQMASRYLHYVDNRIFVVPNWTADLEANTPTFEKNVYNTSVSFIFVGWVTKEKGVFTLIEAFSKLLRNHPNAKLSIVGSGKDLEAVKNLINQRKLKSVVMVYGWVDKSRVKQLLSTHDVFVLPSDTEGMPNSVIEAMSLGLPVISTPVGVMPDYFVNNETILFVEPKNTEELYLALQRLFVSPETRKSIAMAGNQVVMSKFNPKFAIDQLVDCLKITRED